MPTYVCSVPPRLLNPEKKRKIAEAISKRHSEATGAPTFFVQVVIEENEATLRYLGGELASDHIWVRGDIRAGRTDEQRTGMMLKMMSDISAISGLAEDAIWIYVCNLAPTDMVEYGHVLPRPGEEKTWFASLPVDLQNYLSALGTTKESFTL
jgi:phenylpyruvate tautomerase PptA (4-oxalocrotonate tautomerase family)